MSPDALENCIVDHKMTQQVNNDFLLRFFFEIFLFDISKNKASNPITVTIEATIESIVTKELKLFPNESVFKETLSSL